MAISSTTQQQQSVFLSATTQLPSISDDGVPVKNPAFDWSGLNAAAGALGTSAIGSKKMQEKRAILRRSLTSSWLYSQDVNGDRRSRNRRRKRPLLKSSDSKPVPYMVSATTPAPSVVFFPTNEDKGCGEAASVGMLLMAIFISVKEKGFICREWLQYIWLHCHDDSGLQCSQSRCEQCQQ